MRDVTIRLDLLMYSVPLDGFLMTMNPINLGAKYMSENMSKILDAHAIT